MLALDLVARLASAPANRTALHENRAGVILNDQFEKACAGGLSFETPDEATIFGFCRLRLSRAAGAGAFPSLEGCAGPRGTQPPSAPVEERAQAR